MIAVVQRVTEARVRVEDRVVGEIERGLLVLVAVHRDDTPDDVIWTANKLAHLRLFRQGEKHFDVDVIQAGGSILLVSNFTVAAATRRGRRPSFDAAAPPEIGRKLFDDLVSAVSSLGIRVATGEFGADMKVELVNDGPATVILDSTFDRIKGEAGNS